MFRHSEKLSVCYKYTLMLPEPEYLDMDDGHRNYGRADTTRTQCHYFLVDNKFRRQRERERAKAGANEIVSDFTEKRQTTTRTEN